jgi:PRTRC genetic system ThiF family protein
MEVLLVGVGGNGSKLLATLARADTALQALGHRPLHVVAVDPDTVSESNLVRQAFLPKDLGRNKAEALISRLNLLYGKAWEWRARAFQPGDLEEVRPRILVTALDSRRARREVFEAVKALPFYLRPWWVDLGNGDRYGQVLAGNGFPEAPYPPEREPDLVGEEEDEGPSCSVLEALLRQDLLVNDLAAVWAGELVWQILRKGRPDYLGVYYDLDQGTTRSVGWERLTPKEKSGG